MINKQVLILMLLLIIMPAASATVIVNSEDWRDVYTGIQYAASTEQQGYFVMSTQQGTELATRAIGPDITLITGREQVMPGFRQLLQSKGYAVDEIRSNDPLITNQELAIEAPTENIVIVDDGYGYNAIGIGTYAKMKDASVLFADEGIIDVIDQKQPGEILLYGHIPSGLLEDLSVYDIESINEQDKFEDNFELVKKFNTEKPTQNIILTNGEFIELQLLYDETPTLFIGRQNVPEEVIDFLNEGEYRAAVLIGNALAPNAVDIKDKTGMSLFIKFAQGRDQQQYGLDLFEIPVPNPLITLSQAEYDPTRQELLVTYQNPGEISTYFTASFQTEQGDVEDEEPVFIESGTYKTIAYPMPPPQDSLAYTILYGASPLALEYILQGEAEISQVTISDDSDVEIIKAEYSPGNQEFMITLSNPGNKEVYVLAELVDVRIGAELLRIGGEVTKISPGDEEVILVPATLTEQDLKKNQELQIELFYGAREFSLIKFKRATMNFGLAEEGLNWVWVIAGALIAIILIWFVVRKKR